MKRSISTLCVPLATGTFLFALGCSSNDVTSPTPAPTTSPVVTDAGGATPDAASPPSDAASSDASVGASPLNGCATYEDRTAATADRTVVWIRSVGTVCLRIKKGQSVTWNPKDTDFSAHPLKPSGGDATNPIVAQGPGNAPYVQAFASAGTFGFVCGFHFDMTGAIQVVE